MGRFGKICGKLEVLRGTDLKRLEAILLQDEIWCQVSKGRNLEQFKALIPTLNHKNSVHYIASEDGIDFGFGVFLLVPSAYSCLVDVGIIKRFRGSRAVLAAKMVLKDFRDNFPNYEIYGEVNFDNKRALYFDYLVGFELLKKDMQEKQYILRWADGKCN